MEEREAKVHKRMVWLRGESREMAVVTEDGRTIELGERIGFSLCANLEMKP